MHVAIRLLGGFEVTVDGYALPADGWQRRSAAQLVKLLALQPGARMLRDQVVDSLWPDLLLDEAAPRLHSAAHYARAALGSRDAVVLAGGTVSLLPDADVSVDCVAFESAADAARQQGSAEAARAALALYDGDLLPDDLYESWTEEPRARLQRRRLELLPAAGHLEELVSADPLDEEAHLALVRDHLASGRRQAALLALDRLTEVFSRELGVDPSLTAQELRREAEAMPLVPPRAGEDAAHTVRPRRHLPSPRTRLIGRAEDVRTLTKRLQEQRVVTITGPGGAGKSTLALAVARELGEHPGPADQEVLLVELAPVREGGDVVRAVAEAAGVQGEGAVKVESLATSLAGRDTLLVLDNCEHLVDACAALVDAVLDAAPLVRVLATSREPLKVDGELEHRIGSLGTDSAALFVERATAAAGPEVVTAGDARIDDLCERLDGLPLAIELAAAQLRHLALPELIQRLDDRLDLLGGGRPRAGPRHSTLTTTIDWSYQLLDQAGRQVFDQLGVFPASFDLAALQAVTTGDLTELTRNLGDLVAKSLVVHDPGRARYHLLETIRLFARGRLEGSGALDETTERLRRHVVARAREEPRVRSWLSTTLAARSRDDLDTVRLAFDASIRREEATDAVDLALALSTLWRNSVSYAEGRRWVESLRARDLGARDLLWTLILEADVALGAGDARRMRSAAGAAATVAHEVDDAGAAVIAEIYDAMVHLVVPARAAERLEQAATRARQADEAGLERLARGYRMVALQMCGHTTGMREEAEALTDGTTERDYARYLCLWAASCLALVERDGPWLRHLMTSQRADLTTTALHENWLTLYWGSLSLIAVDEEFRPQLRRARVQAEAEGRSSEADCVLALAYAAACREEWESAAAMIGATQDLLLHDTASFIHLVLIGEQLVRPRLGPDRYDELTARGRELVLTGILTDHGL